jgi:hypothetical protein
VYGPTQAESKAMSIGPTEVDGSRSVLACRSGLARDTPLEGSRKQKDETKRKIDSMVCILESFGDTGR